MKPYFATFKNENYLVFKSNSLKKVSCLNLQTGMEKNLQTKKLVPIPEVELENWPGCRVFLGFLLNEFYPVICKRLGGRESNIIQTFSSLPAGQRWVKYGIGEVEPAPVKFKYKFTLK